VGLGDDEKVHGVIPQGERVNYEAGEDTTTKSCRPTSATVIFIAATISKRSRSTGERLTWRAKSRIPCPSEVDKQHQIWPMRGSDVCRPGQSSHCMTRGQHLPMVALVAITALSV
jgi:hypothetical protein